MIEIAPEEWFRKSEPLPAGLYVVGEIGSAFIKIGVCSSLLRRLSALQCGNPRVLKVHALFRCVAERTTLNVESATLRKFKSHKMRGEWLSAPVNDVLEYIRLATAEQKTGQEAV